MEKDDAINKVVFEQFKQGNSEKTDSISSSSVVGEEENPDNSRKRRNPFEGIHEKRRTRKPFLVLGEEDDPQNIRKRGKKEYSTSNEKQKPHYNHYMSSVENGHWIGYLNRGSIACLIWLIFSLDANGSGWWDCEMEGVDSEEVGYGEVWEGVGSTTFGGIVDWH
ncbi:hypothetical protein V6N11_018332 [Hibiscus sabdariffa]|uniref:Uncharacterized protein n=1 Tax=Hibiscus sabdariffa TaxID=183260 RepID=A0ABR2T782_9ROSI